MGPAARPALQSRQAAARSVRAGRIDGRGPLGRGGLPATRSDGDPTRPRRARPRQRAARAEVGRRRPDALRLGRRPAAARRRWHETRDLRGAREGLHDAPPRACPTELRGTYAGPRAPRRDRPPAAASASPRSSCCRSTSSSHDAHLVERGPAQLLGLQLDRLLRAAHRVRGDRAAPASRSAEFKQMVQDAARGRHRGDPRRRLQPHRRGQPPRPDALASRASTTPAYYRLVADDPRYYMDYTGTGNTLNMRHPHVLQLIMDSLRYWVHGDARRRLPLRPRRDARARAARGRPARRRSSTSSSRTRSISRREADRRAVGRRRGRLPGRQLPAAVVGVERQVPRHACATTGAASSATLRRVRLPPHRQLRPLRGRAAAARTRASTSSPRTTASRCATSSRTTTSTTRRTARTTATARRTTAPGTAAPRARPTTREVLALRARQQRNFLATLLLSQGVPMLLGGDELGRTPARQQQRLLPGQRARPGSTGSDVDDDLLDVHAPPDPPAAARTRCSAAAAGSRAARSTAATRRARHRLVHAPTATQMTDEDWARGPRDVARRVPQRRGASRRPTTARRAASSTTASSCCSTRTTSRVDFALPDARWGERWTLVLDTRRAASRQRDAALRLRRRREAVVPVARARSCAAAEALSRGDRAARHLPPAAPARASASTTAAALADYLAALGVSHLYCVALPAGGAGQHARLRRRRPRAR